MSRITLPPLTDQRAKLISVAVKLELSTNEEMKDLFGLEGNTSVPAWKNESRGIPEGYLQNLCKVLTRRLKKPITPTEFAVGDIVSIQDYLELSEPERKRVSATLTGNKPTGANSQEQLNDAKNLHLQGSYIGALRCHERDNPEATYIAFQQYRIAQGPRGLRLFHHSQFTGREESGPAEYVERKFVGQLDYADQTYPPSIFYLEAVSDSQPQIIFYGIYSDVTAKPHLEVFATRFLLFSVDDGSRFPNKAPSNSSSDELIELLSNDLNKRNRLVVESSSYERRTHLAGSVRKARRALGDIS